MNEKEFAQLKVQADANNPDAMYSYAMYIRGTDAHEADKFILLAAHLGQPQAAELYADKCLGKGDYENATHFYRTGARGGNADCAVKLAVMRLSDDDHTATHELEELAESGVVSACSALAAYYKAKGNRKQYNYWHSLINK